MRIERALADPVAHENRVLRAFALCLLTNSYTLQGLFERAMSVAQELLALLDTHDVPAVRAAVKLIMAEAERL